MPDADEVRDLAERLPDLEEERLCLLASVSQAFASSLDIQETLQNAVSQISHYMHAEAASLFLLENDGTELVCRASEGPVNLAGLCLPAEKGIVGKTVRENRIQFIRDVSQDPDFAGFVDASTGFETRSILCAPLAVKDERIGALEVLNRDSGDGLFEASDEYLLQVLASSASLVIHNARMAAELVEKERMHKELELAREIQANLLPTPRPAPFPVAGINIPAREVSGDFYDYYGLPDGRIGFNLGDVAGKGMNAAMLMAKTSSLLHAFGKHGDAPARLLAIVNEEVCESVTRGMFVTMVAGIYDRHNGRLVFTNAGHQPPLYRARDGRYREIPAEAPPLGILPGIGFQTVELDLDGGALYLFTDGVTEGIGPEGVPLAVNGLKALIDGLAHLPAQERLERIVAAINQGRPARRDDVTLMVIEEPA